MKFFIQWMIVFLFSILLFNCSSSSITQRYKHNEDLEKTKNEVVRFSDVQDIKLDTTLITDLSLDSLDEYDEPLAKESQETEAKYLASLNKSVSTDITLKDQLMMKIIELRDSPYKYGGNTKDGLDCSAFTKLIIQSTFNYSLPRSAREQYQVGRKVTSRDSLQIGDLVFFNTSRRRFPGHVGIYLGENLFAHASRSLGVTISSLDEKYYDKRYVGSKRINEINNKL
ncbi:MAG: hypothetical protein Fur0015_03200 [Ignavibacteriales bacterium]